MRIYGSIILAGVLSVAVVAERARGAEIIEVNGCAPGWILLGSGTNWWCLLDPSQTTPPGGGVGGEDTGRGEVGGGGGNTEPVRHDSWSDAQWEDMKKRWRCSQCKVNADKCIAQSRLAEGTCTRNAKGQAEWRCDVGGRKYTDFLDTVTAWGCSIDILKQGLCGSAEAPWNQPHRWNYECKGSKCTGPGVYACEQSWAQSHPEGSTQVVDSGSFSVVFEGVGPSGSKSIAATYQLAPLQGYLSACATLGSKLTTGCTVEETACYNANSCAGLK